MKTKNFSRMMLALFCATLMIMMIPSNSMAISSTYDCSFGDLSGETGIAGSPYDDDTYPTGVHVTSDLMGAEHVNFAVASSTARTGTKSFRQLCSTGYLNGYWNFTYTQSMYLSNFSFWFRIQATTTSYYFFNSTLGIGTPLIYISIPSSSYIRYFDELGNPQQIDASFTDSTYHRFYFNVINQNGDVYYYADNTGVTGVARNPIRINEGYRIDSLKIMSSNSGNYNYHDDLTFTLTDTYGGTTSGCSDFTGSTPTGRFAYGGTDVDSSHISTRYNVPVTTTITGVELQISSTQYDSDSTLSHYECSVNAVTLGNPVCIFSESYYYVIQWVSSVSVTAQTINFDFYHSQLMSGTQYWDVGCGVSSSDDVNGDGEVGFVFTDSSVVYHWEWILGIPFFMPTYGAGDTEFPRDLGMRFWSTGFTATETFDYDDGLGLASYSSSNSTGYIYDLSGGYDNIMGSYSLGDSGTTYTLNLYVNGTLSYDYGFPIHCRYPGDGFGFSPNTIGKYRLQLNSTHAVANVTAWVIGARSGYSIRTNPVISNQFMSYSVIASYNNPQGYTGGIAMDNYVETLNTFLRCMYQRHPVTNNQSTSFTYQSNGTLPEYWGLYVYANGLYTKVDDCKHYLRLPSVYTNDIHTPSNNYPVSTNGVESLGVTLTGTHMFPGGDVRIYANSIYVMNVGDSQYFTETFYPRAFGYYNITMLLYQNGTFTYLANCNFTVSNSDSPGIEDPNQQYADLVPEEYHLFVAIGIILGFMFMPMAFIYSMNKTMQRFNVTVNVPAMVIVIMSIMTGLVGFILTIMWGLLAWWTVFLLIFVLALVVLILYLKGGKTE